MQPPFPHPAPVSAVLNAPGAWLRIAAAVLAGLALVLTAIIIPGMNGPLTLSLPQMAGWTLIGPLIAVLTLASPAISQIAAHTKWMDLISTFVLAGISVFLVVGLSDANAQIARMVGANRQLQSAFMADLGIGAYALFAATVAALLTVFIRPRSSKT